MKNKECRKIERWIESYFDGETTASRGARVEQHLHECPACRSVLERLKKTRDLVRQGVAASVTDAAPDFEAQLQSLRQKMVQPERPEKEAKITQRPRGHWSWGTRILVPSAAVMALLVLFVFTIYKPPAPVIKTANRNECFIESIDGGSSTVMLFKTHGSKMTVIWLSGSREANVEVEDRWKNSSV